MSAKYVGVIGAGSFGSVVANLLAVNSKVKLYTRNADKLKDINTNRTNLGYKLHDNIEACNSLEEITGECETLFPIIPSSGFRKMMKEFSPHLHPYHTMIHGTKGLDVTLPEGMTIDNNNVEFNRDNVKTMSEVIRDESVVVRIGCLAGPNLAKEIYNKQPAATVVASSFDSVIKEGQRLLRSDLFQVYGNKDLIGIELTGVLKNIIALASGALNGLGYGENARAMLISRGLVEMIYLGKELGGNLQAFIGLAGVGDLVATSSSTFSRNFTVGNRLAKGENISEIIQSMNEVAEGVNTVKIVKKFAEHYGFRAPITETLFKILNGSKSVEDGLTYLMKLPLNVDIDFM
ncbi:MAG: NAD(P)-dependent glycerol-3-phosphate dehydrogenase [Cyclobacteriaceae bacterium]|nr:NAD(P)-dependent glycerol-3-phosphate dehydrogenase [Cyclobacteriaceae bacterium]